MSNMAWISLSACDVLKGFASGEISPVDYLDVCLAHISKINPKINALTAIDEKSARQTAEQSASRWKARRPVGRLDGLPIGIKDLQDTKGLLTTHGNIRARANIPANDVPLVARLRAEGAIIVAKTNVPELGAGGNSRNPVWGATGNPFNPNLIAGGSSGGSAAALAADLLPLCTGSDTGGSLRVPAGLCGVVGYRPSVNVVAHPTRPLGWSGISVLGPMARNMDDLILMLQVIHGFDSNDPLSSPSRSDRFDNISAASLANLRVGYSEDFGGAKVDPDIRSTLRSRIEMIRPHVLDCQPVDLDLGDMDRTFDVLRAESFISAFGEAVEQHPDDFGDHIRRNVALGQTMTLTDRAWAHKEQTKILRRFNTMMQDYDVILLPTVPVSPFPWTQHYPAQIDGKKTDIYYRWLSLTYRGSLAGGPSITLPCGRDGSGMPFGLQMLGAVHGDESLLSVAKAFEALFSQNEKTVRPRPDFDNMPMSEIDLKSIVTHPPIFGDDDPQAQPSSMQTAV